MKQIFTLALFLAAIILSACTDSDSYYFDESDSQAIQVDAYITTSFDESVSRVKCDTVSPGDSIIFLSVVQPSKSARSQSTFWTLDGKEFAHEFSFKSSIITPGIHHVSFVFVDIFGDTLSDSITLYVASEPSLDSRYFVPADETQNLDPNEQIRFAWNGYDPDSLWDIYYHFELQESSSDQEKEKKPIVDTILEQPFFTLNKKLNPLTKYLWHVCTFNNLKHASKATLESSFYTQGVSGENAIQGFVKSTSSETVDKVHLVLMDSSKTVIRELPNKKLDSQFNSFYIKPLPAGQYTLVTFIDSLPDFKADTTVLHLEGDQVYSLDSIFLEDTIPPVISALSTGDTLDYADTLQFLLKDGGGKIVFSRTSTYLDDTPITSITLSSDTLTIPLPYEKSWSPRILTITTVDQSLNYTTRNFYLKPNAKLFEEIQ